MPRIILEDFTGDDKEFREYKLRWARSTLYEIPSRIKDKTIALMILVPIYVLFGIYVISEYISSDILQRLILDINHVTIEGMFVSHYLHSLSSMDHILSTSILYFVAIMTVVALNNRRKPIFHVTYAIFLLALPFTLSSYNILFMKYLGMTRMIGFSGIACAFFGYACYLIIATTWNFAITYNYGKYEAVPWFYVNKFLMGTIAIVVLPIVYYILEYLMLNPQSNAITHIAGFYYGLMIPQLVGIIIGTKKLNWRLSTLVFLIILLIGPIILASTRIP